MRTTAYADVERSRVVDSDEIDVAPIRDLTAGFRVAEFDRIEPGTFTVRVELISPVGTVFIERDVVVTAGTDIITTVVITRSCPAAGDSPGAIACLGGGCVDPACTVETPELCPAPECTASADCSAPVGLCLASGGRVERRPFLAERRSARTQVRAGDENESQAHR